MEVQLKQFNFHPGETIEGMIILQLNEKVNAKGVSIQFRGTMNTTSGAINNRQTSETVLIDVSQPLDREREYEPTPAPLTYPFKIVIPENVIPPEVTAPAIGGVLGDALKLGQMFGALPSVTKTYQWELNAKLDIPWGGDVGQKIQITVSPKT